MDFDSFVELTFWVVGRGLSATFGTRQDANTDFDGLSESSLDKVGGWQGLCGAFGTRQDPNLDFDCVRNLFLAIWAVGVGLVRRIWDTAGLQHVFRRFSCLFLVIGWSVGACSQHLGNARTQHRFRRFCRNPLLAIWVVGGACSEHLGHVRTP